MKKQIVCHNAPAAIGPYSQAIEINGMLFISGQIPVDPKTGEIAKDITAQTRRSLENIKAIIGKAGGKLENIVKCTVFLKDMNEFADMNEVYGKFFVEPYPARLAVEVARLPKDVRIEIDAIAVL